MCFMNKCIHLIIDQKSNCEEVLADVILSSETHYNSVDNIGHISDGIALEIDDDIEGNGISNDWTATFCE